MREERPSFWTERKEMYNAYNFPFSNAFAKVYVFN